MLVGFEIAFAAKPVFHGGLEAVEGDAVSGFEQPVGCGEGVVKDGIVGEVAHGEVVDLADGAGVRHAGGVDALDGDAAGEHGFTLIYGWWLRAATVFLRGQTTTSGLPVIQELRESQSPFLTFRFFADSMQADCITSGFSLFRGQT